MEQVELGKNGPKVSRLAYGCMGLTTFYTTGITPENEKERLEVLKYAFDNGINIFDTAYTYGFGENERFVERGIKDIPREKLFIATKFGYVQENGQTVLNSTPENIRKTCDLCLKNLQTTYLDMFQQHRVDPNVPIETVIETLVELKKEGKIRYIGLSECSAETLRRAHKVHPISVCQIEYSIFTRDIETNGILEACRELGIAILAYSPLGRGFLTGNFKSSKDFSSTDFRSTGNYPRLTNENIDNNLELVKVITRIAEKKGVLTGQVALAYLLSKGKDIIPLFGTTKKKNLDENIGCLKVTLTQDEINELDKLSERVKGTRYGEAALKRLDGNSIAKQ